MNRTGSRLLHIGEVSKERLAARDYNSSPASGLFDRLFIRKRFKSAMPSHWGSLASGPSIRTSGGLRSANALIFAHSVVSPQNSGCVSFAATVEKISPGVPHPLRMASKARCSSRPVRLPGPAVPEAGVQRRREPTARER